MGNPELKARLSAIEKNRKESAKEKPTDLQKDYQQIVRLVNDLEDPAPGMDKKLAQEKEDLYAKLNLPKEASLETIKLAFDQAVKVEKVLNSNDQVAKQELRDAGIESPYRVAKVAIELNVLNEEVGDMEAAKLSKVGMPEEDKAKFKRKEALDQEWQDMTKAIYQHVTTKEAMGKLDQISRGTRKVVEKLARKV